MKKDVRDRLLLPLLLPVGILLFIALVLWGFSRILLGLTATAATVTAVVAALGIVVVAAIAAGRTTVRGSTIAAMFAATAGVAMLAGGIALAFVAGGDEGEEPEPPDGGVPVVELAAQDIAFDPADLTVPAGVRFEIAFDNRDAGQQHNVAIYDNARLLRDAGVRRRPRCRPGAGDVRGRPAGAGTVLVPVHRAPDDDRTDRGRRRRRGPGGGGPGEPGGGGGSPGGGGEPGGGPTVVAQNIAFDTQTIDLPARGGRDDHVRQPGRGNAAQHLDLLRRKPRRKRCSRARSSRGPPRSRTRSGRSPRASTTSIATSIPNMNGTVRVG